MFCIIEAINVTIGNQSQFRDLPSPKREDVPGIQGCDRPHCIALAYSPAPRDAFVPDSDTLDATILGQLSSDEREIELYDLYWSTTKVAPWTRSK
jgi:hypothetical protein